MGSIDVSAIMLALKVRLATISGLNAHSEQPNLINCPCAWPAFVGVNYDDTFDGDGSLRFEINVAASPIQLGLAQGYKAVYPYVAASGAKSVKAAIEALPVLGGLVPSIVVSEAAAVGAYETAGITYLGGKLIVLVYT